MAVEITTVGKRYVKYYVEKVVYEYDEDNSLMMTTTCYSRTTKNTSVGMAPVFDEEKWSLEEVVPEDAERFKDVTTIDGTTNKVSSALRYYYTWYGVESEAVRRVSGICVNCKHHTTDNPYLAERMMSRCVTASRICEGQQVITRPSVSGHYCKANAERDFIEGKDVFGQCSDYNLNGECVKYEEVVEETTPEAPAAEVSAPVISQDGNVVSITCGTEGATILYSLDGSEPGESGTEYSGAFTISGDVMVRAVAKKDGTYSAVAELSCTYTSPAVVAAPIVSAEGHIISITCETEGAVITYTTDGTSPLQGGDVSTYTGSFELAGDATVTAVASKDGVDSGVTAFELKAPVVVAPPVISCADNIVTIACGTGGATIYYTTDGSEPGVGGTAYTEPFAITETVTVRAVAIMDGVSSGVTGAECGSGAQP